MPFFSFVLPKWFARKHPKMVANLKNNTKRLTTPFDIYSTLMSVLHKGAKNRDTNKRSISLFDEVIRCRVNTIILLIRYRGVYRFATKCRFFFLFVFCV